MLLSIASVGSGQRDAEPVRRLVGNSIGDIVMRDRLSQPANTVLINESQHLVWMVTHSTSLLTIAFKRCRQLQKQFELAEDAFIYKIGLHARRNESRSDIREYRFPFQMQQWPLSSRFQ